MVSFFAFDRNIFNPRAGQIIPRPRMSWGNGWALELKLFGFTIILARGAR